MGRRLLGVACVLAALLPLASLSKPMGGKFTELSQVLFLGRDDANEVASNYTCRSLSLYSSGHIYLSLKGKLATGDVDSGVVVTTTVTVLKSQCANFVKCASVSDLMNSGYITNVSQDTFTNNITTAMTTLLLMPNQKTAPPAPDGSDSSDTAQTTPPAPDDSESSDTAQTTPPAPDDSESSDTAQTTHPAPDDSESSDTAQTTHPAPDDSESSDTAQTTNSTGPEMSKRNTESKDDGKSTRESEEDGKKTDAEPRPVQTTTTAGNKNGGAGNAGNKTKNKEMEFKTKESGLYIVLIESRVTNRNVEVDLTINLEMRNYYGFLSAIDYPALVFYGIMTAVYAVMGVAWSVAMCFSYKDLVRLQFWVFSVVILGFLEKMFFVSEYGAINSGEDSSFLILLAEAISAAKRGLARVLLIIVSLGFGTVKPRLGDSLGKVVAVGIIYFIFALIDGIVRAKTNTYDTQDTSQIVTLALLFIMDSIIFYWAFTSLVSVRRALRMRKNYVKLSMYNHFAYTLIFAIVAALGFTVWMFVEVNFPKNGCLEDWQEVWLKDCFWHFLFCFILIVIMIIWRPSTNGNRFAYSLVNDLEQEDEEEEEEIENKNFETVKMRTVSRTDTTPPPVSSQAEDDLRWVEENLPTTAMDKALPLLLDSDEEIMNTKFEASKMN